MIVEKGHSMTTTPSRTDLEYEILYNPKFVPLPSPQVKVKTTIVGGKPSYLMKNHANIMYYDLNELTNQIWNLVDGKRTVPEIVEEIQRQRPHVKERTVLGTLLYFAENNLLVSTLEQAPKKRFRVVSPFEINFAIINRSNDFLQSLNKKMRPFYHRFLLWAIIAFIVAISILFAPTIVSIYGKKANFEILGSSVVGFFFYTFITLAPVIAIHEIAHGLTLAHYGGQPGEMGTGLFYFSPMFYVGTADGWGLSRGQRIMVYLAGNISTLLIGSALVVVHLFVTIPEPGSLILKMTAFYCFTMSLFNFAPPFETDGYYILTDVVNMANLRQDSYSYLGSILKQALGMQAKAKIPRLTKRTKRILVGYAVMSVAWIVYSVYQTSIFLAYMTQDVTSSLSKIFNSILASQALSASIVVVAVLSTIYFGMQVMGYGLIFSAAVKKARAKPLQVEAIHDRNLAVFGYLPPQVPESLSMNLRARMEKAAKKLTSKYEMKQIGRSWIAILKMGETKLAHVQIKEHLGRIESQFSSAYQDLIKSNKEILQRSTGIYAPHKVKLTEMFNRIAAESVDAGNSGARSVVRAYLEKQNETLLYLLFSAFGTIWTLEVEPAEEFAIEKELPSSLLLEDLALTDIYGDVENFKKRTIYGFDSLAKLAANADAGLRECLGKPGEYQVINVFEPIRNRIVFFGRTEQIEENIHALASLFIAQTWSGYLDDLLGMTCLALSTVNRSALPSAKEIREMSTGELAVLSKDFQALTENEKLVDKCLEESETHLAMNKQNLGELKTSFELSKAFRIGLLDALFGVNVENMENLPGRIREFRKQWRLICKRIETVQEHVRKEYAERKPAAAKKTRKMLRIYPFVMALSIALLVLGFQTLPATWWGALLSVVLISNGLYWFASYRTWKSFRKTTRYPSQAFSTSQIFILALTEAIHGYVTTEDVLIPL
jgi:hypothetical protein